jgi:hypothetical protein
MAEDLKGSGPWEEDFWKYFHRHGSDGNHRAGHDHILEPGEAWSVIYVLAWSSGTDASSTAEEWLDRWEEMHALSMDFRDALFQSSYPDEVIDALSACAAEMKHGLRRPKHPGMADWFFPEKPVSQDIAGNYHYWRFTGAEPSLQWMPGRIDPDDDPVLKGRRPAELSIRLCERLAISEMGMELDSVENARIRRLREVLETDLWNGEFFFTGESEGCDAGQMSGQSLAYVLGIDSLLSTEKVAIAAKSIYRYNFRKNLSGVLSTESPAPMNGEGGLLTCTWPYRNDSVYSSPGAARVSPEKEYSLAALLIRHNMMDEALDLIRITRSRYRGFNRNPWPVPADHSLTQGTAWDVHLALSGYHYQDSGKTMCFMPGINPDNFKCLWSASASWGAFSINGESLKLEVRGGELHLNEIRLPDDYGFSVPLDPEQSGNVQIIKEGSTLKLLLAGGIKMGKGQVLDLKFRK